MVRLVLQSYTKLKRVLPYRVQPYRLAHYAFHRACRGRIAAGPFAGMRYVTTSIESAYYTKLLGTYELELHDVIEELKTKYFDRLIDIGAAEGYYAVGFAMHTDKMRVSAYEGDPTGYRLVRRMAKMNRVTDQIVQKGFCQPEDLAEELAETDNPLLVVDCEGMEYELLNPARVPGLEKATMLVELHAFANADVADTLEQRFAETHTIRHIAMTGRGAADYPETGNPTLDNRSDKLKAYLVKEGRENDTPWMYFVPKVA